MEVDVLRPGHLITELQGRGMRRNSSGNNRELSMNVTDAGDRPSGVRKKTSYFGAEGGRRGQKKLWCNLVIKEHRAGCKFSILCSGGGIRLPSGVEGGGNMACG